MPSYGFTNLTIIAGSITIITSSISIIMGSIKTDLSTITSVVGSIKIMAGLNYNNYGLHDEVVSRLSNFNNKGGFD